MKKACGNCEHWCREAFKMRNHDFGECRIHPPVRSDRHELPRVRDESDGIVYRGSWPCTTAAQWCSDFKPKDAP